MSYEPVSANPNTASCAVGSLACGAVMMVMLTIEAAVTIKAITKADAAQCSTHHAAFLVPAPVGVHDLRRRRIRRRSNCFEGQLAPVGGDRTGLGLPALPPQPHTEGGNDGAQGDEEPPLPAEHLVEGDHYRVAHNGHKDQRGGEDPVTARHVIATSSDMAIAVS